jgi:hypothetical protein
MQPLDGERNAMAIFNARVTKSRFIRLLTAQPMTPRECKSRITALSTAGRATAERPQSARADLHNMTQALCRKLISVFFHKPEPHGFWLAKNTVAFIGETPHWGLS